MKKYIVGKPLAYHLFTRGKSTKHNKFIPTTGIFLEKGRTFNGRIVFIRMPIGWITMVKVVDPRLKNAVYYRPSDVIADGESDFKYGKPRAGSMGNRRPSIPSRFGVQAGEIMGNVNSSPQIHNMMSSIGGGFGVQAGTYYSPLYTTPSEYGVKAGAIQGGRRETDSYTYSNVSGRFGVVAGQTYNPKMGIPTEYGVRAGSIRGGEVETESYSYADGFVRAVPYPNMQHYGYANPNMESELVDYKLGYTQYTSFDGDFGIQAGHVYNPQERIPSEYGVRAGSIRGGEVETESYSYLGGFLGKIFGGNKDKDELEKELENKKEFSEEEMAEVHKSTGSKMSFGDWLKSEQASGLANNMSALALALINKNNQGTTKDDGTSSSNQNDTPINSGSSKSTILGMHPLTFGIVSVGVLIGVGVTIVLLKNKGKN